MKVFISQPMNGKTDEEILAERNDAYRIIKHTIPDAELIDTFISEQIDEKHGGLKYLAKSIKMLDEAEIACGKNPAQTGTELEEVSGINVGNLFFLKNIDTQWHVKYNEIVALKLLACKET